MLAISFFGLLIVAFVFVRFVKELGRTIPVLEVMLLIAGLQWVIAPTIEYMYPGNHFKYYMYTDEATYMNIVVPLYLIFVLFSLIGKSRKRIDAESIKTFLSENKNIGVQFIIAGVFFDLVGRVGPASLAFVFFLLSLLLIPGIVIVLLQKERSRFWVIIPGLMMIAHAVRSGMFHELLLTTLFVFLGVSLGKKYRIVPAVGFVFLMFFTLQVFQGAKSYYREIIWAGKRDISYVDALSDAFKISQEKNEDKAAIDPRFNQGWIISKIIENTHRYQTNHATVISSLESILLPRFLFPNKRTVVSKEIFGQLTGLDIGDRTSMGPSIIGEFYANFGFLGAGIMLAIWGTILKIVYNRLLNYQSFYPLVGLWLPVIFYQIIKAETMFLKVGNHLFKSVVLIVIIQMIFSEKFRWKLRQVKNEIRN